MSFFTGGASRAPAGGVNPDKIDAALTELDTITDFYNRMVAACHSKCIGQRYTDGELNTGESVCIDRCVYKFTEVQKKVGEALQQRQAANKGGLGGFS
ncbi:Tim10/DDP family zinc finger-domain-containing protein [Schizophyllum commune]